MFIFFFNSSVPRENVNHRIYPVFLVPICEGYNLDTKRQEGPVKESVQQKHLT